MCDCKRNDCLDCELDRFADFNPSALEMIEDEGIDSLVHALFFDDEWTGDCGARFRVED